VAAGENPLKRALAASAQVPAIQGDSASPAAWAEWQHERLKKLESVFSAPGMLDRQKLLDALGSTIRESIASGTSSAVILIDLNKFAEVNAALGPAAGDEVLDLVGRRIVALAADCLSGASSQSPTIGRLDGDHFLIVVPGVKSFGRLAGGAAELVRLLAVTTAVANGSMAISARAAIVQFPAHGLSLTSVLGRGFRLLNGAARTKSDGVAVSEPETAQLLSTIDLDRDLTAALSTDQLSLALQPKVQVTTGLVRGAEALVRWNHPRHGPLPPLQFIEAAERTGLIFDLGLRVLRDACRISNSLSGNGQGFSIAVNVSPRQLAHPHFLSSFLETIDRESAAPETLAIEVTESAAMTGGESLLESLRSLRRCGIGIAIDDFGTGFSNLASLSALPADTLKIDRSLVTGVDQGEKAGALLDIPVQLGRALGLTTVAEGVETTEQYRRVSDLGCDLVQGYFTGRPVSPVQFMDLYLGKMQRDS
jgi:predicted signal transduction protein with EAL and GGDEF domain